jgi:hypothetical protein
MLDVPQGRGLSGGFDMVGAQGRATDSIAGYPAPEIETL